MSDTNYALVLSRTYPGQPWIITDNDYATLNWLADLPKPTKKNLEDLWPQVQQDVKWDAVRAERDRRLYGSDWTQVADAPVDAAAWAAYRQQLRDIPQTFDDPDAVVWPTEP